MNRYIKGFYRAQYLSIKLTTLIQVEHDLIIYTYIYYVQYINIFPHTLNSKLIIS